MPSGAETLSNTPNTVLVQEQDNVDALHIPKKQKQEPVVANAGAETEVKPKRSFKAIANLVIAMKRFQSALNPTYEYGKKQQPMVRHVRTPSPTCISTGEDGASPATSSGATAPGYAFADRGHKASLLFRNLPPTEDEQQQQQQ